MFLFFAFFIATALPFAYIRIFTSKRKTTLRQRSLAISMGALGLMLIVTPMVAEMFSLFGWESSASILYYAKSFWAGVVVFGAFFAIPALVIGWILRRRFERHEKQLGASIIGALVVIPLLAGGFISGYGIWEARDIRIKQTILHSSKISSSEGRIRVAALADLHLANPVQYGILEETVKIVSSQKPDLILALGDIVVGEISDVDRVVMLLSKLQAPLGKYFILGNHEYIYERNYPIRLLREAGFKALRDQGITLGKLNLIGLTDAGQDDFQDEDLPPLIKNGRFTILMKHRPIVYPAELPLFDLQLSGHTHGGQILPLLFFLKRIYPYFNGLYEIGEQKWIYTSPGVGTLMPPIRLLCPPEITIIDLVSN